MYHGNEMSGCPFTADASSYVFISGRPPTSAEVFRGFGRSDDEERENTLALLAKLAEVMTKDDVAGRLRAANRVTEPDNERALDNPSIPAGYTYLGQLVAHDMTFDRSRLPARPTDVGELANLRSSLLDLDCIYGGGPHALPWLYHREATARRGLSRLRLRLGRTQPVSGVDPQKDGFFEDLPRMQINAPDNSFAGQERLPDYGRHGRGAPGRTYRYYDALIADARNEDNLILSQLVVLFSKLHNRIVEELAENLGDDDRARLFDLARSLTLAVYHRVIVEDFLCRLLDPEIYARYRAKSGLTEFEFYAPLIASAGDPPMPLEFAAAAFRVGHAMVRNDYAFQTRQSVQAGGTDALELGDVKLVTLLAFNSDSRQPSNSARIPITNNWVIEWRGFFWNQSEDAINGITRNPSKRITPRANHLLSNDSRFAPDPSHRPRAGERNRSGEWGGVTYRDLARGFDMGLPNGQALAGAFHVTPLTREDLRAGFANSYLDDDEVEVLVRDTPLFYYLLREAELQHGGERLGQLGSCLVAEVIFGILAAQPSPAATLPSLDVARLAAAVFGDISALPKTMADVVAYVESPSSGPMRRVAAAG